MFGPVRGVWPDETWKGWWGDDPPYHVPAFVLTRHPRKSIVMEGGTTFHFVTGGIQAALRRATEAANGRDIRLGGHVPKRHTHRHYARSPMTLRALLFTLLLAQAAILPNASLEVQNPVAPTPVKIGGRTYLAYELHITNFANVDVALSSIEVLAGGKTLARYEDNDLQGVLMQAGASRDDRSDKRVIRPGTRVIFYAWLPCDDAPAALDHKISLRDGTVENIRVGVRHVAPLILAPPLRGGPWVAVYDPSAARGHRRVLFAVNGKVRIPARFAIDWVKQGDDGYGAEVLAVANATVADVRDGLPEPTPILSRNDESGNYVALDLGNGRFAFYEHLKPGSIRVKTGDRVRVGQTLGSLGASGSVFSGPHLHFHVSDASSPLDAEGVPFVIRHYEEIGTDGRAISRTMEMPAAQTVVRFEQ